MSYFYNYTNITLIIFQEKWLGLGVEMVPLFDVANLDVEFPHLCW